MNQNKVWDASVGLKISNEKLTPAQLVLLLPAQSEIDELIRLCREEDGVKNVPQARALRKYMDEIFESPTNHDAWRDLSCVFGLMPMMQWKFLYVAYCLQPEDHLTLFHLGSLYYRLEDKDGAIRFIEKSINCARSKSERDGAFEYLAWIKFPEYLKDVTLREKQINSLH